MWGVFPESTSRFVLSRCRTLIGVPSGWDSHPLRSTSLLPKSVPNAHRDSGPAPGPESTGRGPTSHGGKHTYLGEGVVPGDVNGGEYWVRGADGGCRPEGVAVAHRIPDVRADRRRVVPVEDESCVHPGPCLCASQSRSRWGSAVVGGEDVGVGTHSRVDLTPGLGTGPEVPCHGYGHGVRSAPWVRTPVSSSPLFRSTGVVGGAYRVSHLGSRDSGTLCRWLLRRSCLSLTPEFRVSVEQVLGPGSRPGKTGEVGSGGVERSLYRGPDYNDPVYRPHLGPGRGHFSRRGAVGYWV